MAGTHEETPLNIDLNINNERQDCKIGAVCVCVYLWGERRMKEIKVRYIVDGLHTLI
jgi:hypothetical protein